MLTYALGAAIVMFSLALVLAGYRLVIGPAATDRILALDTLYINAAGLVLLTGIMLRNAFNFEVALVIAMLGFVGTVVLARYIARGDIME
ncbi:MAG TPA: K+/H+ antiporter subunit F [Burkholderiaceae bacterium]|jgi:multicomponent K+:H+ antiporter subunit F|nr:K+/H+ antiporter subunit F [Burkholderiaceae bacterium]